MFTWKLFIYFCEVLEKAKSLTVCLQPTGEALTQSSLLEADGENGGGMVTMTTTVEPMNLHHAMLRSPGRHFKHGTENMKGAQT